MSDLAKRLAALTPEQRTLFELRMKQRSQQTTPKPGIARRDPVATPVQSVDQERLWFMYQLEPQSAAYNVGFAFRLHGVLDITLLERSLHAIVERYEILRTTYATADGQPVQQIAASWLPAPRLVDLQSMPEAEREAEVQRLLTSEAQGIFDLAVAPPLRLLLLRLAEDQHVLLTTMHHIATDWWSFNVFYGELFRLYAAFAAQPDADAAQILASPLPIQFADFAIWQREWLQGEVLRTQLGYWKTQLANAAPLELPTDRPRPTFQTFRGARHELRLSPALSADLHALAQREGATLFMLLLATFKLVLARYSAQTDLIVGSPIANRSRPEVEPLIGFFVNTLILRTDLGGNPTFRELVQRVRQVCLQAYAQQDMPFARLVQELNIERDTSRMPLVQVGFLIVGESPSPTIPGLAIESLEFDPGVSMFELSLALRDRADALSGFVEYNTDLFDAETIARLAGHWQLVLESVVATPEQPIANVPLLTIAERERLQDWNATAAPYPVARSLAELFAAQVARTPETLALSDDRQELTFAALDRRANRLAWHLRSLGITAETRVGLCLPRSVDVIVALLAILKAGGAYVPLDPSYPAERLRFMADDATIAVLLTDSRFQAPISSAPAICLDSLDLDRYSDAAPPSVLTPDNLIYVIYTSGSTGTPKGVLGTQRGAINRLQWMWSTYPFAAHERCCQKTALSFIDSVWEIFGPLLRGVPVHVIADEVVKDPVALVQTLAEQHITRIVLVASLLRAIMDTHADLAQALPDLRYWTASGEAVPLDLAQDFAHRMPQAALLNLYGSSEVAADATYHDLRQSPARTTVPIGRPLANMTAHVLDQALQRVPIGVPGEIYVGGVGLARGYHQRPDLTAERFLPDPFSAIPGTRLYRTGDRGRWRADGTLDYLGRVDFQVKLRGYRIELGEIEAALRQAPSIGEAVVVLRNEMAGGERLVAYVVGKEQENQAQRNKEPAGLRRFLESRLPAYMVPSAFVVLPALPLTPNGKIDRRALPLPELQSSAHEFVAPRNDDEAALCRVWAEVLGVERIGIHDNFFVLGGHSLLGTQVITRLRSALKVDLPLRTLFEAPTIAGLSERIAAAREELSRNALPPIQPIDRLEPLPLSFAQQRLWFLDQLQPGLPGYNLPGAVRLTGALDANALWQSLNDVIARHDALRTTLAQVEGRGYQVIVPAVTIDLPRVDLRSLPPSERESRLEDLLVAEAQHSFDLQRGPLLRTLLVQLDEQAHVLLIVMHHIVSDGWSLGVFVREIATFYRAHTGDPQAARSLPELLVQYADFAAWQRQPFYAAMLAAQLDYWRQQLAGANTVLELPADRPRPAVQTMRGARHVVTLPRSLADALHTLSAAEDVTLFMTLLAAFNVLLQRYTGQHDIVLGTPIANRNRSEIEPLIGFFVNTLALRIDLSDRPSFRELLQRVRSTALDAYAHQDVPFERLVDALQLPRDLSRSPLFQVMFTLQNTPMPAFELPQLILEPLDIDNRTARFDLTLQVIERDNDLIATFEYSTDLFEAATIQRLAGHWQMILESVVSAPARSIARLPLLTTSEEQQILGDWSGTAAPYPADRCFHDLFAARAAELPDAIAVVDAERQLTYRDLDRQANRLAWHLRSLGVAAETRVGVCLPRTAAAIVALLGIFKAGGVYVPLDPSYPEARLRFMADDANVAVLLTHSTVESAAMRTQALVICLDQAGATLDRRPVTPPVAVDPDQLAYIIYTSGSTGTPKGVMVGHRGLANLVSSRIATTTHQPGDRALHFASISFDAAIFDMCTALASGATLYTAPQADLLPGPTLHDYLSRHVITTVTLPPTALAATSAEDLPALTTVIAAGEACSAAIVAQWAIPGRQFINGYGPTESTVCATFTDCQPDGAAPPIGRPVENIGVYVLDQDFQPVPIGVPGEIYVGGVGLARGYHQRPDLTAERFVPNPFSGDGGARLYRTGDRGRWRADGTLDYLGRVDFQVKLRGYRIELGEIESMLLAYPGVSAAVAMVRETRAGHPQLVAYVVGKEQENQAQRNKEPAGLRRFLQSRLPAYMVPSAFVVLPALPLTPNGKIDRNALPLPDDLREATSAPAADALPQTAVETTLAQIWADVLGVKQVGVHDNFFALGGDSILSIQIVARSRQAGLHFAPGDLFQNQTIAQLARVATVARDGEVERDLTPGAVPLTPIQRWFFEQQPAQPAHFNQSLLLEARQTLDLALLEQAIGQVVQHHEVFGLRFVRDDHGWQQINSGEIAPVPCTQIDLSATPTSDQRSALEAAAAETQASLDLEAGPLLRVVLFDLGADRAQRLLIVIHHLVVDGVSWRILLDDLQSAYRQLVRGSAIALPPPTAAFQHWAEDLSAYAQSEMARAELSYWRRVVERPRPGLPLDDPNGANLVASAREIALSLTADETRALLQDVPPVYHTQINDVLLAVLAQGFAAWTGQTALLLDLEGHGRENLIPGVDLSRTVGWFTSVFPVALELPAASDPGAALRAVKEQLRQIPQRGVGYGVLRYLRSDSQVAEQLRSWQGAQINFNYLGQTDQLLASSLFGAAQESSGPNVDPQSRRPYLLEISGIVSGGQLRLQWLYSEQIHRRATIEAFAEQCMAALRTIINHCLAPETGSFTPSDFPAARVNQKELDKLLGMIGQKGGRPRR